jgi:prepilin-type N-terminal cleavage/methylation domain-containing protein
MPHTTTPTPESLSRRAGSLPGARRAFTLIELLVAIGALAFIAAGIAAIFESTGRTISAGKRLSAFSSYANLIQQQMKSDFASMTRDGFLVIRNEYAGNNPQAGVPDSIPLYADDTNPRPRRVDQIMFFAKGSFASAREALDPAFVARSDAARIYYGHGQHEAPSATRYLQPTLNDNPPNTLAQRALTRLGYNNATSTNPNLYASDWTLLRHVTLLRQPQTSQTAIPQSKVLSLNVSPSTKFADSDVQVALQPAASNIFRRLLTLFPDAGQASATPSIRGGELAGGGPSPIFSTGLVDIATTDLTEIRQVVMTADTWPVSGVGIQANGNFWDPASNQNVDGSNLGPDGKFRLWKIPGLAYAANARDADILARSQAWMDDAWPSDVTPTDSRQRDRIRCETTPVNFLGVATSATTSLDLAEKRADQAMLASSNFLPHCTDFIVEWSFGDTFTSDPQNTYYSNVQGREGQTIWHGLLRRTSTLQSLTSQNPGRGADIPAVFPYIDDSSGPGAPTLAKISALHQTIPMIGPFANAADPGTFTHTVRAEMIHGKTFSDANVGSWANIADPLTSYFGYTDPTFDPDQNPIADASQLTALAKADRRGTADGRLDSPGDAAVATIPWAWPKLIRVTLTLADPNDPKIEQTFQFVFDVPEPKN